MMIYLLQIYCNQLRWSKTDRTNLSYKGRLSCSDGFTLIEVMIVVAIFATFAAIATPNYYGFRYKARIARATSEIQILEIEISAYLIDNDNLPNNLSDIRLGNINDSWGNPYQYLRIDGGSAPPGRRRNDQFLVPVNSDYDLYSMGRNGESIPLFTAMKSQDDIVRANDGAYVGLVSSYSNKSVR
jgi:general secretion pathway protein G